MKELDAQRMICDAVRAGKGFAKKLSHRFLVGVPDLLVKVPDLPAALLEVKWREKPKTNLRFRLGVTKPQERFLAEAYGAGMMTGVVSVLTEGRTVWVGIFHIKDMLLSDFHVDTDSHVVVTSRDGDVLRYVTAFLRWHHEQE